MAAFSDQQLVEQIKIWLKDLPCTPDDIRNPTSDFVIKFYTLALEELGVNVDSFAQIQIPQTKLITYNEMYQNIVPVLNLYTSIRYFMEVIGADDFGMSDILDPNPKRNSVLMTRFLKFLHYCDNELGERQGSINEVYDLKTRKTELLTEIEKMRSLRNQKVEKRVDCDDLINKLKVNIQEEALALKEIQKEKGSVVEEAANVKKTFTEYKKECEKWLETKREMEREIKKLEEMVVSSPEKLKLEEVNLSTAKAELEHRLEEGRKQLESKVAVGECLLRQIDKQVQRCEMMRTFAELTGDREKLTIELKPLSENRNELCVHRDELLKKLSQYMKDERLLLDSFQQMKEELIRKEAALASKLLDAEKKYKEMEETATRNETELNKLRDSLEDVKTKVKAEEENFMILEKTTEKTVNHFKQEIAKMDVLINKTREHVYMLEEEVIKHWQYN